jgi:integrase
MAAQGIRKRQGKRGVSYEAAVFDKRTGKKRRKSFPTLAAARSWRAEALRKVEQDTMPAANSRTLERAAQAFLAGIADGSIRDRKESIYKAGTCRTYEIQLRRQVLPHLGGLRLHEITRRDVRRLVKALRAEGLSDVTIKHALDPVHAIYRGAIEEGEVDFDPCAGLTWPKRKKPEVRVVPPAMVEGFLQAVEPRDRALWATAFFAGLRRGELRALRVEDVDLPNGEIHVRRSWDNKAGEVEPKSDAGFRTVPIVEQLRGYLADHLIDNKPAASAYIFGRTAEKPFAPTSVTNRARKAWAALEVEPVGLHAARHTFASILIDAGISNVEVIARLMGHSSATVTLNVYAHMFPAAADEVRAKVGDYLARASAGRTGANTGANEVGSAAVGFTSGIAGSRH